MDELAERLGIDRLEFRHLNALRAGDATATGQVLTASAGLAACLEALRADWREGARRRRRGQSRSRRRCGAASASPACGTASAIPRCANPSTMRIGLAADGRVTLYNGAVDIGQGSNTIMIQIAADALGVPVEHSASSWAIPT